MRIYLSRPHMSGHEELRVAEAFASNFVAPLGPQLDAFEAKITEYLGADVHCIGLCSGSAALHLALRIAGVGRGDEVWISSMTFAGGIFPWCQTALLRSFSRKLDNRYRDFGRRTGQGSQE